MAALTPLMLSLAPAARLRLWNPMLALLPILSSTLSYSYQLASAAPHPAPGPALPPQVQGVGAEQGEWELLGEEARRPYEAQYEGAHAACLTHMNHVVHVVRRGHVDHRGRDSAHGAHG
jgi:hypothetical protein